MLDVFLSELHLTVKKYPKLLIHLFIAFTIAICLEHNGLNIPQAVITALHGKPESQVILFTSLILMFLFAIIHLALVSRLVSVFRDSMRKALKELSTRDISSIIEYLKSHCFSSDLLSQTSTKGKLRIAGFSIAFLFSYHLMMLHLVYFLDSLYNILFSNSLITVLSSEPVYLYFLITLFLGASSIAYYIIVSERELSGEDSVRGEPLARWAEYLVQKYTIDNCVASTMEWKEFLLRFIVIALSPILPGGVRFVNLIPVFATVNYNIVKERLEATLKGEARYKLEGKSLDECVRRQLTEKDFTNLLKHICLAQIYDKHDDKKEIIGVMIFFRTRVTSIIKPILRPLSDYKAIISTSPEEDYLLVYILGLDPSVVEFYVWLTTGL